MDFAGTDWSPQQSQGELFAPMVPVDSTVHGDGYVIPIVIVCKLCK